MNTIAYAALLIVALMKAQAGPVVQGTAPARPEIASQDQPQPSAAGIPPLQGLTREELTRKLRDLGYFNSDQPKYHWDQPKLEAAKLLTPCAIPLLPILVPDVEHFAMRIVPANPSVDPKIVSAPPLPACPQSSGAPK